MPKPHRLLFASIHSYLDPSSGASLATRELLELLAARDWDCRAFTCGVLDFAQETPLQDVLASIEHPTAPVTAALSRGGNAEVFDLESNGVRITLLPTAHSRADKAPTPREAGIFLDLADQVVDRFQPDVLLTYGGHPASLELMRRARARGIAVVFHLHNFGYTDAGQRRIRVHDPRPLHAGLSFNSDTARSRPMGRHDRAPPGRPPVRGPPPRCCQDRGDALGSGAGGRILPAAS
jgi:hypothetical protein